MHDLVHSRTPKELRKELPPAARPTPEKAGMEAMTTEGMAPQEWPQNGMPRSSLCHSRKVVR